MRITIPVEADGEVVAFSSIGGLGLGEMRVVSSGFLPDDMCVVSKKTWEQIKSVWVGKANDS